MVRKGSLEKCSEGIATTHQACRKVTSEQNIIFQQHYKTQLGKMLREFPKLFFASFQIFMFPRKFPIYDEMFFQM